MYVKIYIIVRLTVLMYLFYLAIKECGGNPSNLHCLKIIVAMVAEWQNVIKKERAFATLYAVRSINSLQLKLNTD